MGTTEEVMKRLLSLLPCKFILLRRVNRCKRGAMKRRKKGKVFRLSVGREMLWNFVEYKSLRNVRGDLRKRGGMKKKFTHKDRPLIDRYNYIFGTTPWNVTLYFLFIAGEGNSKIIAEICFGTCLNTTGIAERFLASFEAGTQTSLFLSVSAFRRYQNIQFIIIRSTLDAWIFKIFPVDWRCIAVHP